MPAGQWCLTDGQTSCDPIQVTCVSNSSEFLCCSWRATVLSSDFNSSSCLGPVYILKFVIKNSFAIKYYFFILCHVDSLLPDVFVFLLFCLSKKAGYQLWQEWFLQVVGSAQSVLAQCPNTQGQSDWPSQAAAEDTLCTQSCWGGSLYPEQQKAQRHYYFRCLGANEDLGLCVTFCPQSGFFQWDAPGREHGVKQCIQITEIPLKCNVCPLKMLMKCVW